MCRTGRVVSAGQPTDRHQSTDTFLFQCVSHTGGSECD